MNDRVDAANERSDDGGVADIAVHGFDIGGRELTAGAGWTVQDSDSRAAGK